MPALHGFMVEWPFATPTIGFSKSPSPKPTARSIARLGERATPWVMSWERRLGAESRVAIVSSYRCSNDNSFIVAFERLRTPTPARTSRACSLLQSRNDRTPTPRPLLASSCRARYSAMSSRSVVAFVAARESSNRPRSPPLPDAGPNFGPPARPRRCPIARPCMHRARAIEPATAERAGSPPQSGLHTPMTPCRSQDAVKLAQRPLRIGKMLEERMAEYALEPAALEGQRIDIRGFKSDVAASFARRRLPRARDLVGRKIDPDDFARVEARVRCPR